MKETGKHIFRGDDDLQKAVRRWVPRLRIQDWDVEVRVRSKAEILEQAESEEDDIYGTPVGYCQRDANHRIARISLLNPDEYPEDAWVEQDMEETLVHELLHVVLDEIHRRLEGDHTVIEQVVNMVSENLVVLARGEEPSR